MEDKTTKKGFEELYKDFKAKYRVDAGDFVTTTLTVLDKNNVRHTHKVTGEISGFKLRYGELGNSVLPTFTSIESDYKPMEGDKGIDSITPLKDILNHPFIFDSDFPDEFAFRKLTLSL